MADDPVEKDFPLDSASVLTTERVAKIWQEAVARTRDRLFEAQNAARVFQAAVVQNTEIRPTMVYAIDADTYATLRDPGLITPLPPVRTLTGQRLPPGTLLNPDGTVVDPTPRENETFFTISAATQYEIPPREIRATVQFTPEDIARSTAPFWQAREFRLDREDPIPYNTTQEETNQMPNPTTAYTATTYTTRVGPNTMTTATTAPAPKFIDPLTLKLELIYGRSGSGKTSWILKLARYLYLKTGKRTRWLLADGGGETITTTGWTGPDGFIDLWLFSTRNNPIETSQLICEGYWPITPLDPNTKMRLLTSAEADDVGLWVFEGLTYMSDYIMGEKVGGLAYRMAKGERLNNDDSYRIKDGDILFGGNARTHYGFTQRKMLDLISRTATLPGLKYWSAHEVKVEDQDYRESIFGPDVCGQKLTTRIGASFGNTIHMHVAHLESKQKDPTTGKEVKVIKADYRAYLQAHYDPDGQTAAKYYANTRIDARVREAFPTLVPEYLSPADPLALYQLLDVARAREAELDARTQALPDLPNLTRSAPDEPSRKISLT